MTHSSNGRNVRLQRIPERAKKNPDSVYDLIAARASLGDRQCRTSQTVDTTPLASLRSLELHEQQNRARLDPRLLHVVS